MSDYHSIDALSNSSLSLLKASPAKFFAVYIAKTLKQEETDAMRLGSAVHMLALEPEKFDERYAILEGPINPSTGKPFGRDSKKFSDWLEGAKAAEPRVVLLAEEFQSSLEIAKAFQSHPEILRMMASTVEKIYERGFELSYILEGEDPIKLKCKPDCVIPSEGLIIDLKTTSDPNPDAWKWSAEDFGYHRQAAIYLEAMQSLYGKQFRFLFGVVRSKPPYEVGVYELSQRSIDRGWSEVTALIEEYKHRKANGDWLSEWQKGIAEIDVPERRRS